MSGRAITVDAEDVLTLLRAVAICEAPDADVPDPGHTSVMFACAALERACRAAGYGNVWGGVGTPGALEPGGGDGR